VEYLGTYCYVVDETILPSNNMLAALSVYFFHHPGQPRGRARDEIRKWFWAVACAELMAELRYSSSPSGKNLR
jgi:hypothetical protein